MANLKTVSCLSALAAIGTFGHPSYAASAELKLETRVTLQRNSSDRDKSHFLKLYSNDLLNVEEILSARAYLRVKADVNSNNEDIRVRVSSDQIHKFKGERYGCGGYNAKSVELSSNEIRDIMKEIEVTGNYITVEVEIDKDTDNCSNRFEIDLVLSYKEKGNEDVKTITLNLPQDLSEMRKEVQGAEGQVYSDVIQGKEATVITAEFAGYTICENKVNKTSEVCPLPTRTKYYWNDNRSYGRAEFTAFIERVGPLEQSVSTGMFLYDLNHGYTFINDDGDEEMLPFEIDIEVGPGTEALRAIFDLDDNELLAHLVIQPESAFGTVHYVAYYPVEMGRWHDFAIEIRPVDLGLAKTKVIWEHKANNGEWVPMSAAYANWIPQDIGVFISTEVLDFIGETTELAVREESAFNKVTWTDHNDNIELCPVE